MTKLRVIKANMNSEKVFFRLLHNYSGVHVYVQVEKSRADAYRSEHLSLLYTNTRSALCSNILKKYKPVDDFQQKNRVIHFFFKEKYFLASPSNMFMIGVQAAKVTLLDSTNNTKSEK